MSTINGTTVRAVTAKSGMILPATITPQTDFNLMDTACVVYNRMNGHVVSYDTLEKVKDAMRDASAVIVMYADAKGEIAARCLWPMSVTLTKDSQITARCYCTLRREYRSFRLDRMLTCHELSTPDDAETADDEPHQDWEDSPQGRALAAR
jgi:predicted DNA-binding transcriptional regulator YafY